MKVAIIGAGLSGLACAVTLERNGIEPVIFEKRSRVGDRFISAEAMFSILNRPVKNCLEFLKENYDINLKPIGEVDKLFLHSKNNIGTINGTIGYSNVRGRHEDSYEMQLSKLVKGNIEFNSKHEYNEICKEFDRVVVATGDGEYSAHLGNFKCDLNCSIKGVTLEGEFVTGSPHVWFNYSIVPKGYAWLLPYSSTQANFAVAYPDYPQNIKLDMDSACEEMLDLARKDMDQELRITDKFEITRYMMGVCNRSKIENTYFVGNCFGALSPGFGFGQFTSILTGIYAAYDICGIGDYEKLTIPIYENYNHSYELRKFLENLTDDELDSNIKNLDGTIIDKLIDKVFNIDSSLELLKLATPSMRLWNRYKETKK